MSQKLFSILLGLATIASTLAAPIYFEHGGDDRGTPVALVAPQVLGNGNDGKFPGLMISDDIVRQCSTTCNNFLQERAMCIHKVKYSMKKILNNRAMYYLSSSQYMSETCQCNEHTQPTQQLEDCFSCLFETSPTLQATSTDYKGQLISKEMKLASMCPGPDRHDVDIAKPATQLDVILTPK